MMNPISEIGFFGLCVIAVYTEPDNSHNLVHLRAERLLLTRTGSFRHKQSVDAFKDFVIRLSTSALMWRGITKNDHLFDAFMLLAISRGVTHVDCLVKRLDYVAAHIEYMFVALGIVGFVLARLVSVGVTIHDIFALLFALYCWYMHCYTNLCVRFWH